MQCHAIDGLPGWPWLSLRVVIFHSPGMAWKSAESACASELPNPAATNRATLKPKRMIGLRHRRHTCLIGLLITGVLSQDGARHPDTRMPCLLMQAGHDCLRGNQSLVAAMA